MRALPILHACLLASVVAAGCAGTATGPFPGAPVHERGEPSPEAIPWSAERRLTWADFRGRPDLASGVAAVTTYAITWESDCSPDGFRFRVTSVFIPDQSWVKPDVPALDEESRRTLAHEQTHFDLSEIQARKLRRELGRLVMPCRLTEEELAAAVAPLFQEEVDLQRRYDRETNHGLDRAQQARWEDDVRRELEALNRYADSGAPGRR